MLSPIKTEPMVRVVGVTLTSGLFKELLDPSPFELDAYFAVFRVDA